MNFACRWTLLVLLACLAPVAQAQGKSGEGVSAEETLSAVVGVRAKILPNARSTATLGPQREGSGVLVRDGYVATIGYLVVEAGAIEGPRADGKSGPAAPAGYAHRARFRRPEPRP